MVSAEQDAVEPDTKDWTWVLERPCPDCGFDSRTVGRAQVPQLLRAASARWVRVLGEGEATRRRPDPSVWSPLEYGCHVRDVFRRFDARLRLMLSEDDPRFENWDQDAAARDGAYGEQDPAGVSAELAEAGERLAAGFEAVPEQAWQRPARRSDGAGFTVESLSRYLVHDVVHHVHDVTGELADPAGGHQSERW